MARAPRRAGEMTFSGATPPAAVPDPPPVGSVTTVPPVQQAQAAPVIPVVIEDVVDDSVPIQGRRRRKGGKRTFYAEETLIYRMEDLILQWQRKYRKRYGKFPAGLVEDAFLAEALARTSQVERRLKHILEGGDPQAKLDEEGKPLQQGGS